MQECKRSGCEIKFEINSRKKFCSKFCADKDYRNRPQAIAIRKKKAEDNRENYNLRRRIRYANDSEYRDKAIERANKRRSDPVINEIIKSKKREAWNNNKEEINKIRREKHQKNAKEINKIRRNKWKESGSEKFMEKYYSDIEFNTKERIRAHINVLIRNYNPSKKINSSSKFFDFSKIMNVIQNFIDKEDLSYEDYLRGDYHLDHKIPISYYKLNEYKKGFDYRNYHVLTKSENLNKKNKIVPEHVMTVPKELWPEEFFNEYSVCKITKIKISDILN